MFPTISKRRFDISSRDQESLLEEIILLKQVIKHQIHHLRLHKVHASYVQEENRSQNMSSSPFIIIYIDNLYLF
jgi:hypothetical protein